MMRPLFMYFSPGDGGYRPAVTVGRTFTLCSLLSLSCGRRFFVSGGQLLQRTVGLNLVEGGFLEKYMYRYESCLVDKPALYRLMNLVSQVN